MTPSNVLYLIVLSALLSACMPDMSGIDASYGIDGEEVLSTVSSIEEVERGEHGTDATYTATQYPIVLVHGLYGFQELFGVGYFYRVAEALEMGGATVYALNVAKVNTNAYRGEQLLAFLKRTAAIDGHTKFHLIGHSHGGPTIRYVLKVAPELLASVTSIAGPNVYGTAEPVVDAMNDFWTGAIMQVMANMLGEVIDLIEGNEQAHFAMGAFQSVSETGVDEYNTTFYEGLPTDPGGLSGWEAGKDYDCSHADNQGLIDDYPAEDVGGHQVHLYSWTGTSYRTNILDPIDIFIQAAGEEIEKNTGKESDGFVEKCATHFGYVVRDDYEMNHLDEINNMLAMRKATATNSLITYRKHANMLKSKGL